MTVELKQGTDGYWIFFASGVNGSEPVEVRVDVRVWNATNIEKPPAELLDAMAEIDPIAHELRSKYLTRFIDQIEEDDLSDTNSVFAVPDQDPQVSSAEKLRKLRRETKFLSLEMGLSPKGLYPDLPFPDGRLWCDGYVMDPWGRKWMIGNDFIEEG